MYREEGLALRRRRRKRRAVARQPIVMATRAGHRWGIDFVQDVLETGRCFLPKPRSRGRLHP
jgi:hypothetical protein